MCLFRFLLKNIKFIYLKKYYFLCVFVLNMNYIHYKKEEQMDCLSGFKILTLKEAIQKYILLFVL